MASTSVEHVKLILPSDGKPETTLEARLLECLPLVGDALQRATEQRRRSAVLITEASKVGAFVTLLRSNHQRQELLIGSISEHQWLVPALDLIVATPEEVFEYQNRGWMFDSHILQALLIDLSCGRDDLLAEALNFASIYKGFEAFEEFRVYRPRRRRWFSPRKMVPASPAILELISGNPETWDDLAYIADLSMFSWGSTKIAFQDWCDVPVFLPGIIRGSLSRTWKPLVLAPREKLDQMIKLLLACADELGLSNLNIGRGRDSHVHVECPEELVPPSELERLVIIDADKLLESPCGWKIHHLLAGVCLNSPIGVQFSTRTPAVDELLKRHSFFTAVRPGTTMKGVCQFFSLVERNSEKLDRVCDIWRQLERSTCNISIFCNSGTTVVWLAEQMRSRGFSAWSFCRGDGEDVTANMYEEPFPVIVTDVYRRTSCDVINFDLPDSFEEYLERVGNDRSTADRAKMVINLVTAAEHPKFPEMVPRMMELPGDCYQVHKRLRLYLEMGQR